MIALSFEALVVLVAGVLWFKFSSELNSVANELSFSEDFLKYIFVVPFSIWVWIFSESRHLLQEDKESTRVLTEWSDYSLLKIHVWVALIYSTLFAVISAIPWAMKSGVGSGAGLLLLLTGVTGQFIVAATVYTARIKVRELLAHSGAP